MIKGVIATDEIRERDPVTVYVRVEDTARADAPARVISQQVLGPARLESLTRLPFALALDEDAVSDQWSVFVHIDLDNDGRISPGDYISTQRYPVALFQGAQPTIEVQRVD